MTVRAEPARVTSRMTWVFLLFVALLCCKTLWGYWARDLTFGDTSSYFRDATTWAQSGQINIIWSPAYTAYYGAWWALLQDAVAATLAHRVMLILVSAGLVAWIALRSLPQVLALLMVTWWVVLPIHYDTLYEVHLFAAVPLLALMAAGLALPERWRFPVWLSIAFGTMLLLRNEYVVLLGILACALALRLWSGRELQVQGSWWKGSARYLAALAVPALLAGLAYNASYIQGDKISAASQPKHTLNMCQVYAFGHQQRSTAWQGSPWTECQSLMQATFGKDFPSLGEMARANPGAVAEHVAWNFSLLPGGLELLLFNAISAGHNPDYASPLVTLPLAPRIMLVALLLWGCVAIYLTTKRRAANDTAAASQLRSMLPLIVGTLCMVLAIVATQRPRPSYLLGPGVMLVWVIALATAGALSFFRRLDGTRWPLVAGMALLALAPSYASLNLPSKSGLLKQTFSHAVPHRQALCEGPRSLAIGDYAYEISSYLCASTRDLPRQGSKPLLQLATWAQPADATPQQFVAWLRAHDVGAVIVDPYFMLKTPKVGDCQRLRTAFLDDGWTLLTYQEVDRSTCTAVFAAPG